MKISVIVPTVERVESLRNCLNCLLKQKYPVFEIIVVYYEKDLATIEALKDFPTVRRVMVSMLGHARANNVGKKAATGDILTFIDDDTCPGETWSQKIADHFLKMPDLKGLGGRDRVFRPDGKSVDSPLMNEVGVFKWYGKRIGNHHLGHGRARPVDFVKGCNMSFRASFVKDLTFDEQLLGNASQICNDLDFSLKVRGKKGLIVYDPDVTLEHHLQARPKSDQDPRHFTFIGFRNIHHNYCYVIKKNLGFFMFFKLGVYESILEFCRIHKPYWAERNYAKAWAFFKVLFKRV
jgi:GT2 family glycosyltransferase